MPAKTTTTKKKTTTKAKPKKPAIEKETVEEKKVVLDVEQTEEVVVAEEEITLDELQATEEAMDEAIEEEIDAEEDTIEDMSAELEEELRQKVKAGQEIRAEDLKLPFGSSVPKEIYTKWMKSESNFNPSCKEVKIGLITDLNPIPNIVQTAYVNMALWQTEATTIPHAYMAVMAGPNVENLRAFAQSKISMFRPFRVFWQHGGRAKLIAYESMIATMSASDSILIILFQREDASLKYAKRIAELKGIKVIYENWREAINVL